MHMTQALGGAGLRPAGRRPLGDGAAHAPAICVVTGLIAVIVYRKVGLRMLRTMWINLDLIWGGALVVTGAVALLT